MATQPIEKVYPSPFGCLTLAELEEIARKANEEREFELRDWIGDYVDRLLDGQVECLPEGE